MPTTNINYTKVHAALNSPETPPLISTPYGHLILEIQGELNLPTSRPADASDFVKVDDIYEAVRFGKLLFDDHDLSKVTLLIGKSQRLLGNMVELRPPLGVLRVPKDKLEVQMVDIVRKKIIFKQRPLPIM